MAVTYPGAVIWNTANAIMTNWVEALIILVLAILIIGALMVLTSFEILELVPILSVVIDWLEIIFTEGGVFIFLYILVSLGIVLQIIPICSSVV